MKLVSQTPRGITIKEDRIRLGFYVFFTALLILNLWSLMRYPFPFPDEATLTSRAWNYLSTRHAFGVLDEGIVEAYDHYWIVYQWLITFLHSFVLRFLPGPSLAALRGFSLIMGILLLGVSYILARSLCGKNVAYISVLLLASSRAFYHSAHQVRYDILAALLAYSSLTLVVLDTRKRFWVGLAAGMVTGLAVETHLNALIFPPVIGIVYLISSGRSFYKNPSVWGYALGGCVGLIYYLGLHYFPDPQTAVSINALAFGSSKQPPLFSFDGGKILFGFLDGFKLLLVASGSMVFLAPLAIRPLLNLRSREGYILLGGNAVLFVTSGLIMPSKMGHYSIYLAPAFLILVAYYLKIFFTLPWRGRVQDFAMRVLVWGMTLGGVALGISAILPDQYADYQIIQADINSSIRPDDTVMGVQTYWLGMPEVKYRSWELLFQYQALHPGATLEEAVDHFGTTIFVIDPELRELIADNVAPDSPWFGYHLSKQDFDRFIKKRGDLVFYHEYVSRGLYEVYRIEQGL